MKRKAYFVALCTVIMIVAMCPSVQADDFSRASIFVSPENVTAAAQLINDTGNPDWDFSNNPPNMTWNTSIDGFQLSIECHVVIHEDCSPMDTMDYKVEVHLNVWDNGRSINVGDEYWHNSNWPNPDTANSVNTIEDGTDAIDINPVMAGDSFDVTIEIDVWDCNQNPPVHWDDDITGTIDVVQ